VEAPWYMVRLLPETRVHHPQAVTDCYIIIRNLKYSIFEAPLLLVGRWEINTQYCIFAQSTNCEAIKDPLLRNDWKTRDDLIKQGAVAAFLSVNSDRCHASAHKLQKWEGVFCGSEWCKSRRTIRWNVFCGVAWLYNRRTVKKSVFYAVCAEML
jgi:hypothetical protein